MLTATLMGLIFARTNFRELENFAFRADLISRILPKFAKLNPREN